MSIRSLANEIEATIKELTEYDALIFVVNTDQHKDFQTLLKFHELGSNVVTICVSANDAKAKRYAPVMNQIMHKLNACTGGLNFEFTLNKRQYSQNLHEAM
jgi:lysophospholipase L1-like esterase